MNTSFTVGLYIVTGLLLSLSLFKDKRKTSLALKKAWRMFLSVLPQFSAIILLVGLLLAILPPETIRDVLGSSSGFLGMLLSAGIGSIALIPALVSFPLAAELLRNGAGIAQISVFISTLTMVGLVTLPLETKYLGRKAAVLRNTLFFIFSFITAAIMGSLLS